MKYSYFVIFLIYNCKRFTYNSKVSEDRFMQISYNKLFKLLIDKGMKKTDLAKEAKLTPATLAKLSKQETVSMDTLIRICDCLDCTFDDVVELIKD